MYKVYEVSGSKFIRVENLNGFTVTLCERGASIYEVVYKGERMSYGPVNERLFVSHPSGHYGKTVGPIAGRVKEGKLVFGGHTYQLEKNDHGKNTCHSASLDWAKKDFDFKIEEEDDATTVTFTLLARKDGGYPATLAPEIIYSIPHREDVLDYDVNVACYDDAPLNVTNHIYWSMGQKSVKDLELMVSAEEYATYNSELLHKGYKKVKGVYDLREPKALSNIIEKAKVGRETGYNNDWILSKLGESRSAATLKGGDFAMDIYTDWPALHIYTMNVIDPKLVVRPNEFQKVHDGIAMEPVEETCKTPGMIGKEGTCYRRHIRFAFSSTRNDGKEAKYKDLERMFEDAFARPYEKSFYSHGRLEIIGNHTDHNHGRSMVAGVNMGIRALVRKRNDMKVIVKSKGYEDIDISLADLSIHEDEKGRSHALIRGVAKGFLDKGHAISGFEMACDSDIFPGAGVSSSAAYEALICEILSSFTQGSKPSPMEKAKISQFAEREYFGKPCGLEDQIGACYGGVRLIDFSDPENPSVTPLEWKLPLAIVIANTGGSHASLTPHYAAIPEDMRAIARGNGKEYLGDFEDAELFGILSTPCIDKPYSELQKLRAQHWFDENHRVDEAALAITSGDLEKFIEAQRRSSFSSTHLLRNTMVEGDYENSPQKGIDLAQSVLPSGSARIMGGGFAGSIICFATEEEKGKLIDTLKLAYGRDSVIEVKIEEGGPRSF